ncbi:hypothetical protein CFD26_102794 [Aspergillus turcosus]|uniref:Uncharacterized protein n=1 Tax=Aspergillus turcosus TaxID=1245748 RepID=A0A3R7G582_9EURO|nr:hypothetical protein CFD26_102794 [Aspergillus turcosus]
MITKAHEQARAAFHDMIIHKFVLMNNLDLELQTLPGAEVQATSRSKRPDKHINLKTSQMGVLTNGRQHASPRWEDTSVAPSFQDWLTDFNGDVKIALIILVSQTMREILVEIWELIDGPTRAELFKKVPEVTQRVVMSQLTAQDSIPPLVLPFDGLCLRSADPNEGDIEFSTEDLEQIASKVWRVHTKV